MASKNDIITLPNPHLREKSKKVGLITPEIKQVIQDMKEAIIDWDSSRDHEVSVALAAVQIDQLLRIVIVREDTRNKKNHKFHVLLNPQIVKYDGEITEDYEGCLSIRDIYAFVPRPSIVKVKAIDINGKEFRIKAEGHLARVLQHEVDHTNGKVIIDHVKDSKKAFFRLKKDGGLEQLDYDDDIKDNPELWP